MSFIGGEDADANMSPDNCAYPGSKRYMVVYIFYATDLLKTSVAC